MPNCPSCGRRLTMTPHGPECGHCRRHFSVGETVTLQGYIEDIATLGRDLIELIDILGLPPGLTFEVYLSLALKEVEGGQG